MDDRRTLIADSALAVIGKEGIRALTHHRIDDEASIARGSTSYYCRRRVDILRLALQRLFELDVADLRAAVVRAGDAPDRQAIGAAVAELIEAWLTDDARVRSVARIELFMAASHEPELQPLLAEQLQGMREAALPFARGAAPEAGRRLVAGFMLVDGLMLGVLRDGRPAPSVGEIRELLSALS